MTNGKTDTSKPKAIWTPHPGFQEECLKSTVKELLMAGGRGSGKSDVLLVDALRDCGNKNFRALIIRRTMPELRELIGRAKELYPKVFPGTTWKEKESRFIFPSGARIEFGYCASVDDALRYQGQQYTWLGIDEITQYPTPEIIDKLKASIRTTDPTLNTYIRACVDEGDVLTDRGWINIKQIQTGDKVASVLSDGSMVYKNVYDTAEYDVDEKLVRVKKKNLYMSMTEDHRVMYSKSGSNTFNLVRWNEHTGKSIDILRSPLSYNGEGYKGDTLEFSSVNDYLKFLGIYLAEGCVCSKVRKGNYNVIVTQLKDNEVGRFLSDSPYNFKYCKNGDYKVCKKDLWEYLSQFGKAKDKFIPREVLQTCSRDQLKVLFDWLMLGDGHWQSKNSGCYVTTSKKLSDDFCELITKLGYKGQVKSKSFDNPNWNTRYNIWFTVKSHKTRVEPYRTDRIDTYKEPYKGKVYCISVEDTENFIIRQKGSIWVSGNTTNPSGAGQGWVRERWVDLAPAGQTVEIINKNSRRTSVITRKWLHSTVLDNPSIMDNDPDYYDSLMALPEALRRQWLDGDWTAIEGRAFPDFKESVHVIEPFNIPRAWTRIRACDWGYSSMAACIWMAIDYDDNMYIYREHVTSKVEADIFARQILEKEFGENIKYGVLDGSTWAQRGQIGDTPADTMIKEGCSWIPSDRTAGSRVGGKMLIHTALRLNEVTGQPKLKIFNTCKELISELNQLPVDSNNTEDVDTDAVDHAYDALRYAILSRPRMSRAADFNKRSSAPVVGDSIFGY